MKSLKTVTETFITLATHYASSRVYKISICFHLFIETINHSYYEMYNNAYYKYIWLSNIWKQNCNTSSSFLTTWEYIIREQWRGWRHITSPGIRKCQNKIWPYASHRRNIQMGYEDESMCCFLFKFMTESIPIIWLITRNTRYLRNEVISIKLQRKYDFMWVNGMKLS